MRAALVVVALALALPATTTAAPSSLGPRVSEALATRYAPLLSLHPQERYGPMRVPDFLAHATLRWGRTVVARQGSVRPGRLGARCDRAPEGCYRHAGSRADEETRPLGGGSDAPGFALDLDDARYAGSRGDVPALYDVRVGRRRVTITYWTFYGYDEPVIFLETATPTKIEKLTALLAHEGDWERIVVVLSAALRPRGVRFHQHATSRFVPWERVQRIDGAHPVVWVARGKHASYARPGTSRDCLGPRACLLDERATGGRAIRTWETGLVPVRSRAWYGFGGAWGRAGELADTTGPLGPSRYKR
jgi:hypothetical protein